jgi:hypothetical protein
MGFGLVIAVLGIGSTFAASININGGQDTEFGQGSTRTVYCGGDQEVTIAPISTYVNTVLAAPENSFRTRFALSYFEGPNDFTAESNLTPPPSTVNGLTGWWTQGTNTRVLEADQSLDAAKANAGRYAFTERVLKDGVPGYYKVNDREFREVVITPAVEASEATFRTAGVLISDIPPECDYVDFVVSFFGETGAAQTMISKEGEEVKEVAYNWEWEDIIGNNYTVSRSRTSFVPTTLVTAETTPDSLKFIFNTDDGTALSAVDLNKIVVETQNNTFNYFDD